MNRNFLLCVIVAAFNSLSFANADSYKDEPNLFKILTYLEVNTLSRLLAFKQFIAQERKELRPAFGNGWIYHAKLIRNWTRRLGMYGYGMGVIDSRGNGNCLFNSLYALFHMNNITNADLIEMLNPDLEPAVAIAIKGMLEDKEPITPLGLKRICEFMWLGVDPNDPDSIELFNPEGVLERAKNMAETQELCPNQRIDEEMSTMFAGVDMITHYKNLQKAKNKIPILKKIYETMEAKRYDGFGDYTNMGDIEYAFQIKMIMFNIINAKINCSLSNFNFTPKLAFLLTYENGRHYDVAGVFKLGAKDPKEVKTMFEISEIPIPLLMFMVEDCKLKSR